jgi:LacI family transcriptional regulator
MVPDVVNPFFPELIAGVIDAAQRRGWQVLISISQDDDVREPALLRSLAAQADAVIGYLFQPAEAAATAVASVPLVLLGRPAGDPAFGAVDIDEDAGVRAALRHLVAGGHRRIGMIDCTPTHVSDRRASFLAEAATLGVTVAGDAVVSVEQTLAGGETGFERLHTAHPELTAVFAFNDLVALGAYRAVRRLGLTIPGDVALIGFDGLSFGEFLDPPLTTITIDKRKMGELAVAQVGRLLAGTPPEPARLESELLIRGSA